MRRFVTASRVVVTLSCVSVLTVGASTAHAAGPTTAWHAGKFDVDTANLVRRSNIVLGRAPLQAKQSMDLGNGDVRRRGVGGQRHDGAAQPCRHAAGYRSPRLADDSGPGGDDRGLGLSRAPSTSTTRRTASPAQA